MNTVNELKTEEPMSKQEQIRVLKMFNEDLTELLRVVKEWEQRSVAEKMKYSEILEEIGDEDDLIEQFRFEGAHMISSIFNTVKSMSDNFYSHT